MRKIEFIKDSQGGKHIDTSDNEILLFYFIDEMDNYMLNEAIPQIESVANGEKTFEELEDMDISNWYFGEGVGYFECDKDHAYLKAYKDGHHPDAPDVTLPTKELIQILKEWQQFLNK